MKNQLLFLYACQLVGLVSPELANADLAVDCVPVGGSTVSGGEVVDIECFLYIAETQVIRGFVLDFACTLPQTPGAAGQIVQVALTADPDGDGFIGPSSSGIPYLYGQAGHGPVNASQCVIGGFPFLQSFPPIPGGVTRYLGTASYQVSDCAAGSFVVVLENYSNPPTAQDVTRFIDVNSNQIPFTYTPITLTVVSGTCCDGFICVETANEYCCQQNHPGARWFEGRSCVDAVPCPCLADADCDDETFCSGAETCDLASGLCQPAATPTCDDGVACTVDACDATFDHCTNVPVDGLCDDELFCNGVETCDETLGCVAGSNPCEGADANEANLECDEATDACVVPPIPAVSTWGLVTLALVFLTVAKLRRGTPPEVSGR